MNESSAPPRIEVSPSPSSSSSPSPSSPHHHHHHPAIFKYRTSPSPSSQQQRAQAQTLQLATAARAHALLAQGNLSHLASSRNMHVSQHLCPPCRGLLASVALPPAVRDQRSCYDLFLFHVLAAGQGCVVCGMVVGLAVGAFGGLGMGMGMRMGMGSEVGSEVGSGSVGGRGRGGKGEEEEGEVDVEEVDWEALPRVLVDFHFFYGKPNRRVRVEEAEASERRCGSWSLWVGFHSLDGLQEYNARCIILFRPADISIPRPLAVSSKGLPRSALMSLAKTWLSDCCLQHPVCTESFARPDVFTMPTRLLSIRNFPIHICSSPVRLDRRYATLSHCWGRNPDLLLKLTRATITEFHKEIPLEKLSRTFTQAIEIARELGLDYIWIDSLCIVQDDADDWRRESALMQHVYGNSYINIAASAGADGSYGCFPKLKRAFETFQTVRVELVDGAESQVFDAAPAILARSTLVDSVLASRGWCFQERVLAPRTLHFGRTQLFWECNTKIACECFPEGVPDDFNDQDGRGGQSHPVDKSRLMQSWPSILKIYNSCDFTKASDKLVALGGIIHKIEQQESDTCYAGIWRKNFEKELLWRTYKPTMLAEYRAPSWSWASIEGRLVSSKEDSTPQAAARKQVAHLLDVYVEPVGSDPKGQLRGGQATMLCQTMLQVALEKGPHRSSRGSYFDDGWISSFALQTGDSGAERLQPKTDWSSYSHPADAPFFLLPLFDDGAGLILAPTGHSRGQYRRVGSFYFEQDVSPQLISRFWNPVNCAGEEAFEKRVEDGRYPGQHWVLTIV